MWNLVLWHFDWPEAYFHAKAQGGSGHPSAIELSTCIATYYWSLSCTRRKQVHQFFYKLRFIGPTPVLCYYTVAGARIRTLVSRHWRTKSLVPTALMLKWHLDEVNEGHLPRASLTTISAGSLGTYQQDSAHKAYDLNWIYANTYSIRFIIIYLYVLLFYIQLLRLRWIRNWLYRTSNLTIKNIQISFTQWHIFRAKRAVTSNKSIMFNI